MFVKKICVNFVGAWANARAGRLDNANAVIWTIAEPRRYNGRYVQVSYISNTFVFV